MSPRATAASGSGSRADRRATAAREALSLCADADALAREASRVSSAEQHRLLALLEQRDEIMQDLAEQLAILRHERPTADSALFAATERVVDEADALVAEVCAAVSTTQRVTLDLAARVATRVEEIRAELDAVQRAAHANVGYAAASTTRLVDRVR
ncbi:MAG TPA: hypothetical protein DGD08_01230 [Gemmatimonas aurantiaca]|nr:hypothetical protein [Gemmatimonas aurantiaca]